MSASESTSEIPPETWTGTSGAAPGLNESVAVVAVVDVDGDYDAAVDDGGEIET